MVKPMQARWERWLSNAEQESQRVKERILANTAARQAAQPAPSAEDTQILTPPTVTATARPTNSSMRTQLMPKVPSQPSGPTPDPDPDHRAEASSPTTDVRGFAGEAAGQSLTPQRAGQLSPQAGPGSGGVAGSQPTATGSAPVPPPAGDRPSEQHQPPAGQNRPPAAQS